MSVTQNNDRPESNNESPKPENYDEPISDSQQDDSKIGISFSTHMLMMVISLLVANWMVVVFLIVIGGRQYDYGQLSAVLSMATAATIGAMVYIGIRNRIGDINALVMAGLFLFMIAQGVSADTVLNRNLTLVGIRHMLSLPILSYLVLAAFGRAVSKFKDIHPDGSVHPYKPSVVTLACYAVAAVELIRLAAGYGRLGAWLNPATAGVLLILAVALVFQLRRLDKTPRPG